MGYGRAFAPFMESKPMQNLPNYKTINELHVLIDNLQSWINHHRQPEAYRSTADTLEDMAQKLTEIAATHN